MPAELQGRARFHKICIGDPRSISSATLAQFSFMTYSSILQMLRIEKVSLLKMDVEGHEYTVLNDMFDGAAQASLPDQMLLEVHWQTLPKYGLPWAGRYMTIGEMALLAQRFYVSGYRVVARTFNRNWFACSDFTLVRFCCSEHISPFNDVLQRKRSWGNR